MCENTSSTHVAITNALDLCDLAVFHEQVIKLLEHAVERIDDELGGLARTPRRELNNIAERNCNLFDCHGDGPLLREKACGDFWWQYLLDN